MNKDILNIHLEILDKKRQDLLEKLTAFTGDFVLGGGTALGLQIAHRESFDFDFFNYSPISKSLLEKLSKNFPIDNILVDTPDELTFFTKDIKVTFLNYPFKPHFEIKNLENKLHMFSIEEIALQKAYAIGRRGEYRDYFDLYTILKNEYIDFGELIKLTKKTYENVFDEKLFLEQLVYFDDLSNFEIIPVPDVLVPEIEDVKRYFEELVKTYLESIKKPNENSA